MDWAIVCTVKAPVEQVLAFLAHHLSLGAAQVSLYFDDPEDPAIAAVSALPRVSAVACDAAHWSRWKIRPERHQNRQARNALRAYRLCRQPWIAHIDVDEYLLPDRPMAEILASVPPDQAMVRAEPFEAMHDPALPDDIFTARAFRGPLKAGFKPLRAPILGRHAAVLPEAMLSHSAGKAFFRTGIPGLVPRLHGATLDGVRLSGPRFDRRVKLLHFHAQDRAAWLRALPFRLTRGAYQFHEELQAHLSAASPEEIAAFYDETQILTPEKAEILRSEARLIEVDLRLREKVAALVG